MNCFYRKSPMKTDTKTTIRQRHFDIGSNTRAECLFVSPALERSNGLMSRVGMDKFDIPSFIE